MPALHFIDRPVAMVDLSFPVASALPGLYSEGLVVDYAGSKSMECRIWPLLRIDGSQT